MKRKATTFKDLTGRIFGFLTVLELHRKNGQIFYSCKCTCGNLVVVAAGNLRTGHTKSCGCLALKVRTKHGLNGSKFWNSWNSMVQRCTNPNVINYHMYGGRGIKVCVRWLEPKGKGFLNYMEDRYASFLRHVEEFGEKNTTNERIDPNKDYTPENTCWATYPEQGKTKRTSPISEDLHQHHYWKRRLATLLWQGAMGQLKNSPTFEHYVGLTTYEFRYYLQEQFRYWMTWDNNGKVAQAVRTWCIDHRVPCYKFDLSKEEDRLKCFNYINLRPLDSRLNSKSRTR